jgi:hypothetical protein
MHNRDFIINIKDHTDINFASLKKKGTRNKSSVGPPSIEQSPREEVKDILVLD